MVCVVGVSLNGWSRTKMKCEICGKGPQDGTTIYRANEKGVKGIWRCARHPSLESFNRQCDPELNAIENAINGKPPESVSQ